MELFSYSNDKSRIKIRLYNIDRAYGSLEFTQSYYREQLYQILKKSSGGTKHFVATDFNPFITIMIQ